MAGRFPRIALIVVAWGFFALCSGGVARSQVVVQQPVFGMFGIRTTVTVPDGGTMRIGGVSNYSAGSTRRGVPGVSNVPGLGRGFANRALGVESGTSQMSVSVQVLSLREMEQEVLAEAERRLAERQRRDPNGSAETQRKADFITRNIGRTRR